MGIILDLVNEVWKVKDFEFWLGMFFTFLSIVAVYCAIKIRDKKIMKEIHNNQIKVEPSKKFPLYKAYSIKLILITALLGFLPLLIISFCESIFLDGATFHTIAVHIYRISPFCIILSYILILMKPHIYFGKGGLLLFEKELSLKFNIIDKKSLPNEEIKNLPEEVSASEDVIKRFRKRLRCIVKLKYEYYEYLKMYYEGFKVYVGVIEKKKYLRT